MRPRLILVFARAPVPGRCKTRLMPRYGALGAARLHRRLTEATVQTALAVNAATVELHGAPDTRHAFFAQCRRGFGVSLRRQSEGDLGRRMSRALAGALQRSERAVVVGTDCAALRAADIEAAFAALDSHDAVLQASEDGGYVLLGARRWHGGLLQGIAWSSGREFGQTLRQLQRAGLSVALPPPLWDVDRPADAVRARRQGLIS